MEYFDRNWERSKDEINNIQDFQVFKFQFGELENIYDKVKRYILMRIVLKFKQIVQGIRCKVKVIRISRIFKGLFGKF